MYRNFITTFIFVILGFQIQTFAQREQILDRVYRKSEVVYSLINDKANLLTTRELETTLDYLRSIERTLRSTGNPDPGPGPRPPRPSLHSVRGNIETSDFNFEVEDLGDLYGQCSNFVRQIFGTNSVDDIKVSINFGEVVTLRNSSTYWKGDFQVCNQIIAVARNAGVRSNHRDRIVTGSIEDKSFHFSAVNVNDLSRQCEEFVSSQSLNSVDDIIVSVNFSEPRVLRNSSSYWKGPFEICQQVLQNIR